MIQRGQHDNWGAWFHGLGDVCCRGRGLLLVFLVFLWTRTSRRFGVAPRVARWRLKANADELICATRVLFTGGVFPICIVVVGALSLALILFLQLVSFF